jgi:hypothetical protein
MSQLAIREAEAATGLPCLTAAAVQEGACNSWLLGSVGKTTEHLASAAVASS